MSLSLSTFLFPLPFPSVPTATSLIYLATAHCLRSMTPAVLTARQWTGQARWAASAPVGPRPVKWIRGCGYCTASPIKWVPMRSRALWGTLVVLFVFLCFFLWSVCACVLPLKLAMQPDCCLIISTCCVLSWQFNKTTTFCIQWCRCGCCSRGGVCEHFLPGCGWKQRHYLSLRQTANSGRHGYWRRGERRRYIDIVVCLLVNCMNFYLDIWTVLFFWGRAQDCYIDLRLCLISTIDYLFSPSFPQHPVSLCLSVWRCMAASATCSCCPALSPIPSR